MNGEFVEETLEEALSGVRALSRSGGGSVRVSNCRLYQEIVEEYGRPVHASDILACALERGLRQGGSRSPMAQLKSSLESCKRVYNVGWNRWWVVGRELP